MHVAFSSSQDVIHDYKSLGCEMRLSPPLRLNIYFRPSNCCSTTWRSRHPERMLVLSFFPSYVDFSEPGNCGCRFPDNGIDALSFWIILRRFYVTGVKDIPQLRSKVVTRVSRVHPLINPICSRCLWCLWYVRRSGLINLGFHLRLLSWPVQRMSWPRLLDLGWSACGQ